MNLPGMRYTVIGDQSPTSGSTITFADIPSTFDDLLLVFPGTQHDGAASDQIEIYFNNDTTANNYWRQLFRAYGTTTESAASNATQVMRATGTTQKGTCIGKVWIPNYTGAVEKLVHSEYTFSALTAFPATGNLLRTWVSLAWDDTSAITEIDLTLATNSYASGSRIILYGVSYNRP